MTTLDERERTLFKITWTTIGGDRIEALIDESWATHEASKVAVAKPELGLRLEPRERLAGALQEWLRWQLEQDVVIGNEPPELPYPPDWSRRSDR